MKKRVQKLYTLLYVFLRLAAKERKSSTLPLSFFTKLGLWTNGFFSASYFLYRLDKNNRKDYLSDWQENYKGKYINSDTSFIDNKLVFPQLAKPYVHVPNEPMVIMQGRLLSLDKLYVANTFDKLLTHIQQSAGFVFKPIDGSSGDGIIKISKHDDRQFLVNKNVKTYEECVSLLSGLNNYLVSECIIQAEYANAIYPESINTIRILTLVDPDSGVPFIAAAAHRIGNNQSKPVDNCAKGGYTAEINIETGELGAAISTIVKDNNLVWHEFHPNTNAPIKGVMIPRWSQIKQQILDMASAFSFIPYIGWDIVVTADSFLVIEANNGPDIKLHQVHKPLLTNPRIAGFYKHYKVIS